MFYIFSNDLLKLIKSVHSMLIQSDTRDYFISRVISGIYSLIDWLVVGVLRPGNIEGHIRTGTDLS